MNAITIRNLSDEVSRALEARAAEHGTTTEAEVERILEQVLLPEDTSAPKAFNTSRERLKAGTALWELGQEFGGLDDLDFSRDQTPARGVSFE
jgi:plasmid stability protein